MGCLCGARCRPRLNLTRVLSVPGRLCELWHRWRGIWARPRAAPTCISKTCLICKNKKHRIWHTCANAAATCTNTAAAGARQHAPTLALGRCTSESAIHPAHPLVCTAVVRGAPLPCRLHSCRRHPGIWVPMFSPFLKTLGVAARTCTLAQFSHSWLQSVCVPEVAGVRGLIHRW